MNIERYNYKIGSNYFLNKTNTFSYSVFDTLKLRKNIAIPNIDLDSIIASISRSFIDMDSDKHKINEENHDIYYSLDIKFISNVNKRYNDSAKKIFDVYNRIDSKKLLIEDEIDALKHNEILKQLDKSINKLKLSINQDLLKIIDYIDKEEKKLDLRFLNDNNSQANILKEKYNLLILNKSVIQVSNINFEMARQEKRLFDIRNLDILINSYYNEQDKQLMTKYKGVNFEKLKNNLSLMLSEYIYMFNDVEFNYIKDMYNHLEKKEYGYVDGFINTYRIAMDKIWKHALTNSFDNDYNYLICNMDSDNISLYLMNKYNKDFYVDIGYICSFNGDFTEIFNIDNINLLKLDLPNNIKDKYLINSNGVDFNRIYIDSIYNKSEKKVTDLRLPVVNIM